MPTAGVRGSQPSPPNTKPSAKSRWVLWGPQVGLLRKRPGAWGHRSRHPISAGLFLPLHASRACPPRIQGPGGETHMPGVTSLCARAVPPPFLAHLLVSAPALSSPVTPTCPHPSSHQTPARLGTTASSLWLHPLDGNQCAFAHRLTHALTLMSTLTLVSTLPHWLTHALSHLGSHSLSCTFTHSLTHACTHTLTHIPTSSHARSH